MKFPLNSKTSLLIKAIYPFVDKDGTEYLTFQNNMEPEILVYNMKKQTYVRTISFDREGANGIGWFGGYYIKSWDEIYLPEMTRPEINIVNSDGRLLRTISYAETVQGKQTIPFISLTSVYTPMVFIGHQLYIPQTINLMHGSKALEELINIQDNNVYVRILPTTKSIENAEKLGFLPNQILAIQGPFSESLEREFLDFYKIGFMLTKDSGDVGGTDKKILACQKLGVKILALSRPKVDYYNVFNNIDNLIDEICR